MYVHFMFSLSAILLVITDLKKKISPARRKGGGCFQATVDTAEAEMSLLKVYLMEIVLH